MIIAKTLIETRTAITAAKRTGQTIGLVPTMGALHEGHFSLIRRCRQECGFTAVSIFVNPTQFGPQEDLNNYPRPFDADCRACEKLGVDLIFAPETQQMYPRENLTWINVEKLGDHLCGATRPGHFRGVCTVVAKLFNILMPDIAYFGQKDAQQLAILERMTADLNFPVEIRSCPTVRESDGLAMSSRNKYLSGTLRQQALCLNQALQHAAQLVATGQQDAQTLIAAVKSYIEMQPDAKIEYISIVDKELLQPRPKIDRPCLIALAVRFGPARLIDNILLDPPNK